MSNFNKVKNLFKTEQLVFEKPKKGSRRLVFDMGVIPTVASLLLLFSTVGVSIFFTNNNISKSFSTENSLATAGQISISKTLLNPSNGFTALGDTVTFRIIYSNIGTVDIASFDLVDSFPSTNLQYLSTSGITENHKVLASKDNHAEDKWAGYNYGDSDWLYSRVKPGDNSIAYIHFDLSPFAGLSARIADLNIYLENGEGNGNDLEIYGMTSPWEEGTLDDQLGESNWTESSSTTSWNTPGGDFTSTLLGNIATPNDKTYLSSGLTIDTIQKWIDTPAQNYGIALLSSGNTDNWLEYRSREAAANKVPYLDLEVAKMPDFIGSDFIVWDNITDLAVGASDTVEVSFLAIDTCTACINKVFGGNSNTEDFDEASVTILEDEGYILLNTTLISPSSGITNIGDTIIYRVAYSNVGTKDIITIPLSNIFSSSNMQFAGVYGNTTVVTDQPSKDNWLRENDEDKNYGADKEIKIRLKNNDDKHGLMHFDLSAYSGYHVANAELNTFIEAGSGNGNMINVYEVTRFWDEGNEDGNNDESNWIEATQPVDWDNEGGDYNPTLLGSIPTDSKDWYSTILPNNIIQNWIDNSAQNFGLILLSSGNDDKEIKLESNEGNPSKISFLELTLQQNVTIDYQNGDTIKINNLGALSAGATDSIDIYFLATNSCFPCANTVTINNAVDIDGGFSSDSYNSSAAILSPSSQITLSNELIDPANDTTFVDETATFRIIYSNSGTTNIDSLPLQYIFPSGKLDFSSIILNKKTTETVIVNPSKDNYLEETDDFKNYGSAEKLSIISKNSEDTHALMQFDLSGNNGKTVESASLNIFITGGEGKGNNIETYALNQDWDEGTEDGDADESNWLNATSTSSWTNAGGDYSASLMASLPTNNQGYTSAILPNSDVQNWIDNSSNNHGILLRSSGATVDNVEITAREYSSSDLPYLEVELGVEPNYVIIGDTLFIENLGALGVGESDTIEISFTTIDTSDLVPTYAQVINALDENSSIVSAADNSSVVILNCADIVLTPIDNTCPDDSTGMITVSVTTSSLNYSYTWSDMLPEAQWTFESTLNDVSGNAHHEQVVTGPIAYNADAQEGSESFEFDGATKIQYSVANGFMSENIASRSISMWIKPADLVNNMALYEEGSEKGGIGLRLKNGNIHGIVVANGGFSAFPLSTSFPVNTDWHHVGLVYDGDILSLYLDGIEVGNVATGLGTIILEPNTEGGIGGFFGWHPFVTQDYPPSAIIAMMFSGSDPLEDFYNGLMDNVSNYDIALSADQMEDLALNFPNRTNLPNGDYTLTVSTEGGCVASETVTISDISPITIDTIIQEPSCFNGSDGKIKAVVYGCQPSYSYLWSTGSTLDSIENLSTGTYTLTVIDGGVNQDSFEIVVGQPEELILAIDSISNYNGFSITCNGENDGAVYTTPSGGTAPYTFAWNVGAGTSEDSTGLLVGYYRITVTDANGCTAANDTLLTQPSTLGGGINFVKYYGNGLTLSCEDSADGFAVAYSYNGVETNPTGVAPYSYLWSDGQTEDTLRNASAGKYYVTATDSNGCTNVDSITFVNPPPRTVSFIQHSDIRCVGGNEASVTANGAGGSGGDTYSWSHGATTQSIADLSAGIYTVTIADENNCLAIDSIEISDPDSIIIIGVLGNPTCTGTDGSISISMTGGTGSYTQTWSGGQTTTSISGLSAGTYTVTVSDDLGCLEVDSFILNDDAVLAADISATDYGGFEISCFGASDGNIDVEITGGTGPYSYNWNSGQTTEDLTNVVAGNYIVTITDTGGGCTITRNITLDEPAELGANIADISTNDFNGFGVSCFGESDGFVFVSAFGGDGSHNYLWSTGATTSGLSNLSAGDYTVTVTDGRSCTWSSTYSLPEPNVLELDTTYMSQEEYNGFGVSCNGNNDGIISVAASGGEGTYSYVWSNGATTAKLDDLVPGVYTVTLTDGNNCDTSLVFTITEPDEISISSTITNISCNGAAGGEIDLEITGGTGNYTYSWSNGATTQDISALDAGDYTVLISDENSCHQGEVFTITEPDTISATGIISNVNCFGGNDGAIAQTVIGGTPPYSFMWSNGATTQGISDLIAGTYTVSITDFYNCPFEIKNYVVGEPTQLTISETHSDVSCFGGTDGDISITPSGGTPTYDYLWSNGATTSNLNSIVAGTYTITVTDANNCSESITVNIGEATEIIATESIENVRCNGESNGRISLAVAGGNPGYTYNWNTLETNSTILNLSAGTYTVTISDNSSCTAVYSYTVVDPTILNVTISDSDPLCFGDTSGELTANPTGGTSPYTYAWNNGSTTQVNSNLSAGTYTVTVTDDNNCSTTLSEVISTPTPISVTHQTIEPSCNGDSNGRIRVTPTGGVSPYTYQWNVGGTSNTLNNIPAGNYTVTITDLQNCDFVYNITLTEPSELSISSVVTDILCHGDSTGAIDLTTTGGTPNYVFDWEDMDNEGMWTFEETMDDASGNNHDPTGFSGNEDYSTDAVGGQYSFDFDGNSKIRYSVNFGGFMENSFRYMTISMWVKPDALTQVNTLFERGTSSRGLALRMDQDDIQGVVTLSSNQHRTSKVPFPTDGDWHHLALVYDDGDLVLYLDGVVVSTVNTPFNVISASTGNGGIGGTQGSDAFGNTGNRYYEGLMDNAFFHNSALTASQVQDLASNNGDRTNLSQGTYDIEITDGNGCKETASITINEPTELTLTTNATDVSCNGGSDGVATVVASGATSPYTYSWGGAETNASLSGISIGDYTVTVSDNNGCTNTATVTIAEPTTLTANATAQDANCNGASDGQISLTVNGGTPTYTYLWSGGAGTSQNPTGLSANIYTVTVTDDNGCTTTTSATVGEPTLLSNTNTVRDISCSGETDGSITTTATGGTTNYSYNWSNGGGNNPTISNLGVGTYTVTVTDTNGCTSTASSSISEPSIVNISSTITNVSCNGGDDGGVIALNVTGGNPGYTYLWSDMDVEAYYGFEQSMNDETGNGHNPLGGQGTEAYALDNIERDYAFDFDGSSKIEYEENNVFLNGVITEFSVSMWVKPDNFTGTQILFEMGGVGAGFGIRLNGNLLQVGANESFTLYALQYPFPNDGDWHHVTITFDNGDLAFYFDGVYLGIYPTGIGSVFIANNQEGGLGGTFGSDAFGGTGNSFYDGLMDGVGYFNNPLTPQQVIEVMNNDGTRSLLSADNYTVTVIDANGCLTTQTLSVVEPPALTVSSTKIDISCNGSSNGSIDVTVGGGTPNYSYIWSNSATTQDLSSLSPGTYTVTVTDSNGCTISLTETILEPTSLSLSTQRTINYNGNDISCAGSADGAVEVIISGGTPNYDIAWSSGQTTEQINGLAAGTYTVTVSDDNGCTGTSQISLSAPPSINLSVDRTIDYNNQDVSCNGASDGGLGTTVNGGSGTYSYSWSNGETTASISDLSSGTYTVTVTDGFGCTVTGSDVVSEPPALSVSISLNGSGVSCSDATDGNVNSTVAGGTTAYTYLWNGGQTTANLTNIGSGVYMLTVTDANDCTAADTLTVTAPSDLNFTTSYSDLTDCGADDGRIGINASGGTGDYEYSIDGTTWHPNNEFYDLAPGTYNLYVRNSVGSCLKGPKTVVINVPEAPVINNTVLINPSTDVSTDGSIIVNASGNGVQLNYQLEGVTGWQASSVFSNLSEGVYTIKVKYYNQACETTTTIELVAGGGVVGGSQDTDYCSGDINSGQLVEIYYIPLPEDQVLQSLYSFNYDGCGFLEKVSNPVKSYVSIGVVEEGTIIYYDHWEDGYEPNLGFPIQSTTEIWGDGILSNGFAPGYETNDLFQSSDNIILSESIDTTTAVRIATIDYDGSDKIASRGNIAMTRLAWASETETLLAGAIEVYPLPFWGVDYEIPVGENYLVNDLFEYTGVAVMASKDNTVVNIDADASGTPEITVTLNEGESYLVNGGVNRGGSIQASDDVQVHLITGDVCAGAESRWFTLKPTEQWSAAYYTPVSTIGDDTYVHIYNPSSSTITINWETNAGSQTPFTVGGGQTVNRAIPNGSGAKFFSNGNEDFYAVSTTTTFSDSRTYDWGFALIPEDQLSPQITLVSLAPGIDPTIGCTNTSVISQSSWSLLYADSEELVDETAPATNAFDGDNTTYWMTEYGSSNPTHPHEIQIDLGATHNISGFQYQPRTNCTPNTNSYTNTTNVTIGSGGGGTYISDIVVGETGIVEDINLPILDIDHTYLGDLDISLTSPDGTTVKLFNNECGSADDILIGFDDEAALGYGCPPTNGGVFQPFGNLSDFIGEDINGTWRLTVLDQANGDGGRIDDWTIQINSLSCSGSGEDGAIENYEFYVSTDGTNWGSLVASGTFPNSPAQQEITFSPRVGRYIRLVSTSELNGNPWTSVAELNVIECVTPENSAPVWITAAYPTGSTSVGNISVCVDYNGDGGLQTDANGISYDSTYLFAHLDREKILDADGDQTGMRIWVCDGSDAIIAGAWGQDPSTASGGSPAIDLGVGLPNGIPFSTSKCVNLSKDYNLDGNFDECDEVIYTIIVENTGVLPLSVGSLNIIDTLPNGLTYIENTTVSRTNGANDPIPDETSTGSIFPLDENGINYNSVIQPGDSIILFFQATIDDLGTSNGTTITNRAYVSNFQTQFVPEVTFPVENPEDPLLTGVPTDVTVECDSIPIAPLLDEPNCTFSNVDYPAGQASGTKAMDDQVISGDGVMATFNLIEEGITEEFRIADNLYPRNALQNIPCGASTKAIDFQIQQAESNGRYGSDSTSVFEIDFSQPVENLSFSILDLDESLFYVDAVEVRIFDGANAEIEYDCGYFDIKNNVDWVGGNEFQALDNTDGFSPVAPTDDDGDVRFTFYNLLIKRVEITLKNNWNSSSTTTGTNETTFNDYMTANPGIAHGVGIGQICYCIPGTNDGTIFIANDCAGLDTLTYVEVRTDGSCDSDYTLTRTWTATDHCGNDSIMTQVITVEDNTPPVLFGIPEDVTVTPSTIPNAPPTDCSDGINLALEQIATQSSIQFSSPASNVVDGDLNTFNHTLGSGDPQSWWEVDLGSIENVSVLDIYNRVNCCQSRTSQYYILVSETPFASNDLSALLADPNVFSFYQSVNAAFPTTINISRNARYVRVQLTSTSDPMNIAEVMVYGSVNNCITALDGCDSYPTIAFSENTVPNTCNYTIERIWTATDECGNIQRDTQEIFVEAILSATDTITSDYNGRDISCNGDNDGAAHVIAEGGVRPFNYAWSGGISVDSFATGLSAGTYTVTITDDNGCTTLRNITLNDPPPIDLIAQATSGNATYQISCNGANDGTAFANATNGTGTITYQWSTGATTQAINGLTAGTYTVTATDANLCQTIATVTLAEPTPLTITTSIVAEVSCIGAEDGSLLATPSGGVTPYSLLWSSNDSDPIVADLGIGTYGVTVTDGNGCTATSSIILNDPTPITINFNLDNPISCEAGNDGQITASANGGAGGFSYAWDNSETTATITNLSRGKYIVTVTDANNCIEVDSITISDPTSLVALISVTSGFNGENISCTGESDGRVKVFGSGGTSPYTYLWSDAAGTTIDSLDGVPAGTYTVTITDDNSCTTEASIEVFDPVPLVVDAGLNQNICPDTDVRLGAEGTGGTSNYTYEWSTGAITDSVTVSSFVDTTFYVTITDANNCTSIDSVKVFIVSCVEICDNGVDDDGDGLTDCDDPDCFSTTIAYVSSDYNGEDISCENGSDGEATVESSGGKSPYTYLWNDPLGQTSAIATGLSEGTYTVTATDDHGCTTVATVTLQDPNGLSLSIVGFSGTVSCTGDTDGFIDISVSGGTTITGTDYTYLWSEGGQTTQDIGAPLGAGTYTVTVTDINNCQETISVTIAEPTVLSTSTTIASAYGSNSESISCVGATDGLVVASATGGDGVYSYEWNTGSTNDSLINVGAGTYTITISDGNGCTSTSEATLTDPPILTMSTAVTPVSDCSINDGTITVTASGSTENLEYSIDNINWQPANTFTNLSSGTYPVYVRNTDQTCYVGPEYVTVDEPDAPTILSIAGVNPQNIISNDGEILVDAVGETDPLEYRLVGISPWQTSSYFQGLDIGTYTIEVRNVGGNCTVQSSITLINGGGVFGNSGASYCSDDFSNHQIFETYYIPFPEDQVLNSVQQLYSSSCGASSTPTDPMRSYVSIAVAANDTRIYYDHWEDDFETDLGNISQSSTEIWGDGDLTNGTAPGFSTTDIIVAGDVIILDENIVSSTRVSVIDYDGGDKISTTGNISITRLAWANNSGTLLAGAVEMYPTFDWGFDFEIPVGQNADVNEMFEYTGAVIMAKEDNTTLIIDVDPNTAGTSSVTINEGESYLINGGIQLGATINASSEVQVHLITGDICADYATRWITLLPKENWSNSYFNPVGTQTDSDPNAASNDPTFVHIYNPTNSLIVVKWDTESGAQSDINVPANSSAWVEMPDATGAHFYSNGGEIFYATATIDSEGNSLIHDWGYAMIPESQLTSQIAMIGFAPGQDPTYTGSVVSNVSPIWVTGDYPSGSGNSGSFTICIDYNGDGGPLLDANSVAYDVSVVVNQLGQAKIFDPDGDQSGMRIWVCDGSDAIIAGAWGQDPATSNGVGSIEELDLGTGIPNGIPFNTNECVDLTSDSNNDGLFDVCEEVTYTISIQNSGALPFPANTVLITDTLAAELDYSVNSTIIYIDGIPTTWADDSAPPASSTFPFDEGGVYYPNVILPGDSIEIVFSASINAQPTGDGIIHNVVTVFDGKKQTKTNVSFYVESQTPPVLLNIPADLTVSCDSVPNPPALDTANCTLTTVPYPAAQPSGTTAMNAQNLTSSGVTTTYSVITGGIIEDFNMTDGQYSRSANQNQPCGASTKAISLTQEQEASNSVYGAGDSTVIRVEFSQEVEDLSFGLLDFDEGVWFLDGATVRVYDAANNEINYDCSQLTIGENVKMEGSNHFHALDNSDGYMTLADSDSIGDVRFNFYDIPVKRVDIILKNDWNSGSTSSGTSATSFADYFASNPDVDHGIAISEMCFCVPGTIAEEGTIIPADDCRNEVMIAFTESTAILSCANNYTITRTWTATDGCGQSSVYTQQITVEDNEAPTITGVPSDITVTPSNIPSLPIITVDDNCDATPIISYSVDSIPMGCQYIITRIWESEDNCSNIVRDTQNITVDVTLTANATATSNYNTQQISCNGESDGEAAVIVSGDHYPFNYAWSNTDADSILNGVAAGVYTVTVTNSIGCTTSASVTITEPTPVQVTPKADTTMCAGEPFELTALGSGGNGTYLYSWNNGLGNGQSHTVNPVTTTIYTVTVTDLNNCTTTDQISVTITSCTEDCTDGIDNDLDGFTDCDDTDCTPIANNATLNTCDNSNMTGFGIFFLHDANPTVSSESGVMISYHSVLIDAQNGVNTLTSPYTSSDTIVYARVERVSSGCFATSEIILDVGAKCAENCNNGIDDDGDGLIDCDDPDCPCCKAYAPTLNGLNKK